MMTKEEIIEVAKKVGWGYSEFVFDKQRLLDFVKLIAEKEREECAKVAENISSYDRDEPEVSIAKAIRARGQYAKT